MKESPRYYYFLIAVIAIIFVIILENSGYLNKPKEYFVAFLIPVQKTISRSGSNIYDFFRAFIVVNDIKRENLELKFKNKELLSKLVQFDEFKLENILLKKQLNLDEKEQHKLSIAEVVGGSPQNGLFFLLIDKGSEDGIKVGMPVIIGENCLVGKILETNESYSKVLLIYDGNSKVSVMASESRIKGILRGGFGYEMTLDMVPRDSDLKEDDIIITSGEDMQFPKGLIAGTIKEIKKFDNQIFQQVSVRPIFEINEIEKVFVILNY